MKSSGIGGQAVIEGVMMRNRGQYAIAIRKPNGEIEVDVKSCTDATKRGTFFKLPIIRGILAFIDSLTIGMKTLRYSASFYEEEDDKQLDNLARTGKERAMDVLTVALSIVLALVIFVLVPMLISSFIAPYLKFNHSGVVVSTIEGVLRVMIFILYIVLISQMEDIKRMFMYHGAEHKCINCIEHGRSLTVDNVRRSSKEHKRCGTSFMLNVMLISILLFMIIDVDNIAVKLVLRLVLIPIIAGISYEFTRLAGNTDNKFVNLLSKPGLLMQALTTKEPDDSMIEVGIASVEAVFDWEPFVEELKNERRAVRNGNILKIKAEEAEAKEKATEQESNKGGSSNRRNDGGRSKNRRDNRNSDNRNNDNRNNNKNKQNRNKQAQGKNRNNSNNNGRPDNKTEQDVKKTEERKIEAVAAQEIKSDPTEEKKTVPPISEEAFKPLEVDISDLFDIKLPETEEKNVRNFHKSIRGVEQVDEAALALRRRQNEKEADELLAALDIMFEYDGTKTVTEMSEDPAVTTAENVVFDFDSEAVRNAQEAIDTESVKQEFV